MKGFYMTSKEMGLAKIWREIRRVFRQVENIYPRRLTRKHFDSIMRRQYEDLNNVIRRSISTAILHQKTFAQFKNIHQGQEIVIVATGPSANKYKRIDNAIHIGVNRAFKIDDINLRYLFMQDHKAVASFIKEANRYNPDSCMKFYGLSEWNPALTLSESDAIEASALRYRIDKERITLSYKRKYNFSHLIDSEPLGCFESIVFAAVQFALWTNPQTVYLVGCDCTDGGHFDGCQAIQIFPWTVQNLVQNWVQLKKFAHHYYPETKILSINSVGLKGIFDEHNQQG